MGFLFDQNALVSPLKNEPDAMVCLIEAPRVNTIELPHSYGKVRVRRFREQMVMIGHQAAGVNHPMKAPRNAAEYVQKEAAVCVGDDSEGLKWQLDIDASPNERDRCRAARVDWIYPSQQ